MTYVFIAMANVRKICSVLGRTNVKDVLSSHFNAGIVKLGAISLIWDNKIKKIEETNHSYIIQIIIFVLKCIYLFLFIN